VKKRGLAEFSAVLADQTNGAGGACMSGAGMTTAKGWQAVRRAIQRNAGRFVDVWNGGGKTFKDGAVEPGKHRVGQRRGPRPSS